MRRLSLVVVFPLLLAVLPPLHADLVAHWPLDDSGEDIVGGFDGLESGGITYDAIGANDNTDGAASFQNGVIDVVFAPELNPERFSITLWAKSVGGSGYRSPLPRRTEHGGGAAGCWMPPRLRAGRPSTPPRQGGFASGVVNDCTVVN